MKDLTKKQRQILTFIQEYMQTWQYAPSYREIAAHFSFRSLASVYKYVHALQKKGTLTLSAKNARSLLLTEQTEATTEKQIPFVGQIVGGHTLEMFPSPQMISVPAVFVRDLEKTYVLRVMGEELLEEQMIDGDLLIVEARPHAQQGETVLAEINAKNILVKRYFLEEEYIRLEGIVKQHQPIVLHQQDVIIQGVVVGLLRFYTNGGLE